MIIIKWVCDGSTFDGMMYDDVMKWVCGGSICDGDFIIAFIVIPLPEIWNFLPLITCYGFKV